MSQILAAVTRTVPLFALSKTSESCVSPEVVEGVAEGGDKSLGVAFFFFRFDLQNVYN
jgi:hypothetical protein